MGLAVCNISGHFDARRQGTGFPCVRLAYETVGHFCNSRRIFSVTELLCIISRCNALHRWAPCVRWFYASATQFPHLVHGLAYLTSANGSPPHSAADGGWTGPCSKAARPTGDVPAQGLAAISAPALLPALEFAELSAPDSCFGSSCPQILLQHLP